MRPKPKNVQRANRLFFIEKLQDSEAIMGPTMKMATKLIAAEFAR